MSFTQMCGYQWASRKRYGQYVNHLGKDVEVLTLDGKKYQGELHEVNDDTFSILRQVKKKEEGSKRPRLVDELVTFSYDEIKYTKYLISFK